MFCTKCSHENPDDAKFCNACGAQIYTVAKQPQSEPILLTSDTKTRTMKKEPDQGKKKTFGNTALRGFCVIFMFGLVTLITVAAVSEFGTVEYSPSPNYSEKLYLTYRLIAALWGPSSSSPPTPPAEVSSSASMAEASASVEAVTGTSEPNFNQAPKKSSQHPSDSPASALRSGFIKYTGPGGESFDYLPDIFTPVSGRVGEFIGSDGWTKVVVTSTPNDKQRTIEELFDSARSACEHNGNTCTANAPRGQPYCLQKKEYFVVSCNQPEQHFYSKAALSPMGSEIYTLTITSPLTASLAGYKGVSRMVRSFRPGSDSPMPSPDNSGNGASTQPSGADTPGAQASSPEYSASAAAPVEHFVPGTSPIWYRIGSPYRSDTTAPLKYWSIADLHKNQKGCVEEMQSILSFAQSTGSDVNPERCVSESDPSWDGYKVRWLLYQGNEPKAGDRLASGLLGSFQTKAACEAVKQRYEAIPTDQRSLLGSDVGVLVDHNVPADAPVSCIEPTEARTLVA
jgi:hypothetical protein